MIISYRLEALKKLTDHLKLIKTTPDEDFGTFDLSKTVFRGRSVYGANDPPTMISILEAPRPDVGSTAGDGEARKDNWQLLVQGWCPEDPENPCDNVYLMMQVVEYQLQKIIKLKPSNGDAQFPDAYMLGRTISSFSFGPGVVRPPTEGVSSKSFFYLPVFVGLIKKV